MKVTKKEGKTRIRIELSKQQATDLYDICGLFSGWTGTDGLRVDTTDPLWHALNTVLDCDSRPSARSRFAGLAFNGKEIVE